jgi:hypothetical protein
MMIDDLKKQTSSASNKKINQNIEETTKSPSIQRINKLNRMNDKIELL